MNRWWKVIGVAALAGLVALAGAAIAFAQGPTPTPAPGFGSGMMGGRGAMLGGANGLMAEYHDQMHARIAEALGLTLDEFNAELAEGKTPYQIVQERGVDAAALQAAMQAAHAEALNQAVADGRITPAQAEWMLSHQAQMRARHSQNGYGLMND
jgi:hypothetical protein